MKLAFAALAVAGVLAVPVAHSMSATARTVPAGTICLGLPLLPSDAIPDHPLATRCTVTELRAFTESSARPRCYHG